MPNKRIDISKKTAYDVKEASNPSLSRSAQIHYGRNAQAGLKADNPMNMNSSYGPSAYGQPKMQGSPGKFVGALIGGLASKAVGSLASAAVSSLSGSKQPEMQGQPHMESNKQEKYNLINDNPLAKHASNSWVSKHMK